jgi:hypothetical protein
MVAPACRKTQPHSQRRLLMNGGGSNRICLHDPRLIGGLWRPGPGGRPQKTGNRKRLP